MKISPKARRSAVALSLVFLWWGLFLPTYNGSSIPKFTSEPTAERRLLIQALQGDHWAQDCLIQRWTQQEKKTAKLEAPREFSAEASSHRKIVAQTVTAAEILLGIGSGENLVAVPQSVRQHVELWAKGEVPSHVVSADRRHSEYLFLQRPNLALVADYSNPAMLATFSKQNIPTYTLSTPNSFEALCLQIEDLGTIAASPEGGRHLAYFLREAWHHLQHLANKQNGHRKVLIMTSCHPLEVLGKDHLLIQCLQQLDPRSITFFNTRYPGYFHPLDREQLLADPPDLLLIADTHPQWVPPVPYAILEEWCTNSTSQWLLLSLYDVIQLQNHEPTA